MPIQTITSLLSNLTLAITVIGIICHFVGRYKPISPVNLVAIAAWIYLITGCIDIILSAVSPLHPAFNFIAGLILINASGTTYVHHILHNFSS